MAAGPASRLGSQSPGIKQGCGSNHTLHLALLHALVSTNEYCAGPPGAVAGLRRWRARGVVQA